MQNAGRAQAKVHASRFGAPSATQDTKICVDFEPCKKTEGSCSRMLIDAAVDGVRDDPAELESWVKWLDEAERRLHTPPPTENTPQRAATEADGEKDDAADAIQQDNHAEAGHETGYHRSQNVERQGGGGLRWRTILRCLACRSSDEYRSVHGARPRSIRAFAPLGFALVWVFLLCAVWATITNPQNLESDKTISLVPLLVECTLCGATFVCGPVLASVVLICAGRSKVAQGLIIAWILALAMVMKLPVPKDVWESRYVHETLGDFVGRGGQFNVYQDRNDTHWVWKQKAGVSSDTKTSLVRILGYKFNEYLEFSSISRWIKVQDSIPYLARCRNLDLRRFRWEQEKVGMLMLKSRCPCPVAQRRPDDFSVQLRELNQELAEHRLYILDLHSDNVGVDAYGRLKVVDGDVFSDEEMAWRNWFFGLVGTKVFGYDKELTSYANASRCQRWTDSRGAEDEEIF